jgi:regulator of sigma D
VALDNFAYWVYLGLTMKEVHPYEDLRKLHLRVQKLHAARLITAIHTYSSTSQEMAQKIASQFKPIFQLIKGIKQHLDGDSTNATGITKEHYLEFRKLVSTLCEIGESLDELAYLRDKTLEDLVNATLDLSFITSAESKPIPISL